SRKCLRVLAGGDGEVGQTAEILALGVKRRHFLELGKVDHSAPRSDSPSWRRVRLSSLSALISGEPAFPVKARRQPKFAAETGRAPMHPKNRKPRESRRTHGATNQTPFGPLTLWTKGVTKPSWCELWLHTT